MSLDRTAELSRGELITLVLRWFAGIAALLAVMIALANFFRKPLENLGRSFVDNFGYSGMLLGTFIADGFHFPVPPQFYMLMAVTSGASEPAAFCVISVGSVIGGYTGYRVAARLAELEFVAKKLERARAYTDRVFSRFGYRAAVIASLMPIAFSVLCYLAGMHGLPRRVFAVLCLCRIPRLLIFFYLVKLGWAGL